MADPTPPDPALRLFVSYAAEDDEHRIALEKHLGLLRRQRVVEEWSDRKILPGGSWGDEIDRALESADVVLLLVSVDFLNSNYCWDVELERALERHEAGDARVVPIAVRECDWEGAPFAALQALPDRAKPVVQWDDRDAAWSSVAAGIRRLGKQIAEARRPSPADAKQAGRPDPTRYLEALLADHSYVEIRGMGATVSERLPLTAVYTRLRATMPREEPGSSRRKRGKSRVHPDPEQLAPRDQELHELLPVHPHAALVGDPGSGKTTFLRYVAQCLVRAAFGEKAALGEIGLSGEPLFPIFVPLERLAKYLQQQTGGALEEDAPTHFHAFLERHLEGHPCDLPASYLRERVQRGGCFLLLDGLDEVPGTALRQRLARLVEKLIAAGDAVGNHHLVTCRTRAYQGRVQLAGKLATLRLAPFERPQIEQFVDGWSRALYRAGDDADAPAARKAAAYRDELLAAIYANPASGDFVKSPVLLTVLAVVYWNNKGRLPEQRAVLYQRAVEYLLESRQALASHTVHERAECLRAVAIQMFEHPEGVQRRLGRAEAASAFAEILGCRREDAIPFVEAEELYSGLLVSRVEGEVEFWHLTFQEYLAARELSVARDGWERLLPNLHDDRWREVVLLLAGCLRLDGLREARRFVQRILDTGAVLVSNARAVGLVGQVLNDVRAFGGDPSTGTDYEARLERTLSIFQPGGEDVDEPTRIEVGEALGRAGDPRLADAAGNRVQVPAGAFWMGAQGEDPHAPGYDEDSYGDEHPHRQVTLSAFWIGRHPVTVGEYARFLAASDGHGSPRVWLPEGWAWREREGIEAPEDWEDQRTHPTRPVTGVSWYEAEAYARWAGGRLPTEAQWERAARGCDGRRYPWGGEPPSDRRACFDGRVAHSVPVGIYPDGASPEGVRDLAGNAWEWCLDVYADSYEGLPDADPARIAGSGTSSRVLRGGAWLNEAQDLRAAYRHDDRPENRSGGVGFRVVWSSAGGQDLL